MDLVTRFATYMSDYELTSADGKWDRIRAHLTEDFVHERDARPLLRFRDEGADTAIKKWQDDVKYLDQQFDARIFVPLGAPERIGQSVRLRWVFLGVLDGTPAFIDEGVEIANYREGRMRRLRGEYHQDAIDRMALWIRNYGHLVPKMVEYFGANRGGGRQEA